MGTAGWLALHTAHVQPAPGSRRPACPLPHLALVLIRQPLRRVLLRSGGGRRWSQSQPSTPAWARAGSTRRCHPAPTHLHRHVPRLVGGRVALVAGRHAVAPVHKLAGAAGQPSGQQVGKGGPASAQQALPACRLRRRLRSVRPRGAAPSQPPTSSTPPWYFQLSTSDRMTRRPARSASATTVSRPRNTASSYCPGWVCRGGGGRRQVAGGRRQIRQRRE